MEKEKEALLTEMQQLKEGYKILKNELDERLREIHHLRVCSTLSDCNLMYVATEPKAVTNGFISFRWISKS